VTQKTARKTTKEREISMSMLLSMNVRSSVRPRLMFKARMTPRIFGMAMAITISRIMKRNEEENRTFFIHLRH